MGMCIYQCVYKSLHLCVCLFLFVQAHAYRCVQGHAAYAQTKDFINYYFSETPVSLFFETRSNTCLVLK